MKSNAMLIIKSQLPEKQNINTDLAEYEYLHIYTWCMHWLICGHFLLLINYQLFIYRIRTYNAYLCS